MPLISLLLFQSLYEMSQESFGKLEFRAYCFQYFSIQFSDWIRCARKRSLKKSLLKTRFFDCFTRFGWLRRWFLQLFRQRKWFAVSNAQMRQREVNPKEFSYERDYSFLAHSVQHLTDFRFWNFPTYERCATTFFSVYFNNNHKPVLQ